MGHLAIVQHAHYLEVVGLCQAAALDVLVEGDEEVIAACQDAACRTRRSHELRSRLVADDGNLIALVVHLLAVLHADGDCTEDVGLVGKVARAQVNEVVQRLGSRQGGQRQQVLRVGSHCVGILEVGLQHVEVGIVHALVL